MAGFGAVAGPIFFPLSYRSAQPVQWYTLHRHEEFIRFLNAINAEVPAGKNVHVILDNYATHKHPQVIAWLARHKRFTFHLTPTSCSWLHAVGGYFAKLSKQRLKRGVFRSVVELKAVATAFRLDRRSR